MRSAQDYIGAMQRFEPEPDVVYTIEDAGHIAHTTRRMILLYCKQGLVSPASDPAQDGYYFNAKGIRALRRIEFLRSDCGVNLAGIKVILRLLNEVERRNGTVEGREVERIQPGH
jgi:DNA-binding transcriptional MerR regulator